jgi:hypothetical protein
MSKDALQDWYDEVQKNPHRYSVWVGGIEVNDYLMTWNEACRLSDEYCDDGYECVVVDMMYFSKN